MYTIGTVLAVGSFIATRQKILEQHRRARQLKTSADNPGECADSDAPAGWSLHDGQLWYSNGTRQCAWDGTTKRAMPAAKTTEMTEMTTTELPAPQQ